LKSEVSPTNWYLYQINTELGFLAPCKLIKIPKFHLYGDNDVIQVVYLKSIDDKQYRHQLEEFSRYLFEYVFDDMNTNSILRFDIEQSTFKLLPCLLTSGEIDYNRMKIICNRKNKFVRNYSELNDNELYCLTNLSKNQLYMNISDRSLLKRASDVWDHETNSETIKTYADYFENRQPNITIQRDSYLATMKGFKKPKINYLTDIPKTTKDKTSSSPTYHPIEYLHYAPLNKNDFQLIYKLPSLLVRISQLYRIEKLRKLFADNIKFDSVRLHTARRVLSRRTPL
jgi:hypothetical protein